VLVVDETTGRGESSPTAERQRELREAIRAIVVTRERTPRSPRWAAAWRRNLFRYVEELGRLAGDSGSCERSHDYGAGEEGR
jgi:hypothetical protein